MAYNPFEEARRNKRISELLKENQKLKEEVNSLSKENWELRTTKNVIISHAQMMEKLLIENGVLPENSPEETKQES